MFVMFMVLVMMNTMNEYMWLHCRW